MKTCKYCLSRGRHAKTCPVSGWSGTKAPLPKRKYTKRPKVSQPEFQNGTAASLAESVRSALDEDGLGGSVTDNGAAASAMFACDGKRWRVTIAEVGRELASDS